MPDLGVFRILLRFSALLEEFWPATFLPPPPGLLSWRRGLLSWWRGLLSGRPELLFRRRRLLSGGRQFIGGWRGWVAGCLAFLGQGGGLEAGRGGLAARRRRFNLEPEELVHGFQGNITCQAAGRLNGDFKGCGLFPLARQSRARFFPRAGCGRHGKGRRRP